MPPSEVGRFRRGVKARHPLPRCAAQFPAEMASACANSCRRSPDPRDRRGCTAKRYKADRRASVSLALKGFGKGLARQIDINDQQGLIVGGIEVLVHSDHFAPEQPAQASGIQIATLEGLVAKVLPQGLHEGRIGAPIRCTAVPVAFTPGDRRDPFGIWTTDYELEIGTRKTARKATVFQHDDAPDPAPRTASGAGHRAGPLSVLLVFAVVSRLDRNGFGLDDDKFFFFAAAGCDGRQQACQREKLDALGHFCLLIFALKPWPECIWTWLDLNERAALSPPVAIIAGKPGVSHRKDSACAQCGGKAAS